MYNIPTNTTFSSPESSCLVISSNSQRLLPGTRSSSFLAENHRVDTATVPLLAIFVAVVVCAVTRVVAVVKARGAAQRTAAHGRAAARHAVGRAAAEVSAEVMALLLAIVGFVYVRLDRELFRRRLSVRLDGM